MKELDEVVKELSRKYNKKEKLIRILLTKSLACESNKYNAIENIEKFYKK